MAQLCHDFAIFCGRQISLDLFRVLSIQGPAMKKGIASLPGAAEHSRMVLYSFIYYLF